MSRLGHVGSIEAKVEYTLNKNFNYDHFGSYLVYTPGYPALPHPSPHDAIPGDHNCKIIVLIESVALPICVKEGFLPDFQSNGPPASPYKSHIIWTILRNLLKYYWTWHASPPPLSYPAHNMLPLISSGLYLK